MICGERGGIQNMTHFKEISGYGGCVSLATSNVTKYRDLSILKSIYRYVVVNLQDNARDLIHINLHSRLFRSLLVSRRVEDLIAVDLTQSDSFIIRRRRKLHSSLSGTHTNDKTLLPLDSFDFHKTHKHLHTVKT